jgi:ATP-dependent RNA helicase RhlE
MTGRGADTRAAVEDTRILAEGVTFASLGLPEPLLRGVKAAGYSTPTPIQARAIPMIMTGQDLVAAAQTGSGKTAAFILPTLAHLMAGPRRLRALVLVPTRELAAQVEKSARDYARFSRLRTAAVYGGVAIGPQERKLRDEGVDLLVATPGRLLDLHGRQSVSLDEVEVLILDEADRMVDMGFAPDLKRILRLLPPDRQTLMFSATMPPALNTVASEALYKPQRLEVTRPSKPASSIEQRVYFAPKAYKADLLESLLDELPDHTAIVFTRTKRGADRLARRLQKTGYAVDVMHGDRSQSQRERALRDFKRGKVSVLVATDIASRGIDVEDISHVINYDVPATPDDYVHRIGRTGRMHATGSAYTLVSPEELGELSAIEKVLGHPVPRAKGHGTTPPPASRPAVSRAAAPLHGGQHGHMAEAVRGLAPGDPSVHHPPGRPGGAAAESGNGFQGRKPRPAASGRRGRRR